MSTPRAKLPDTHALLAALRNAVKLCRSLNLPKEASSFQRFVNRFQKKEPTVAFLRDEFHRAWQLASLKILARLKDWSEYRKIDEALRDVMFPGRHEDHERIKRRKIELKMERKRSGRKAVMESGRFWQLEGESDLRVVTIPAPPKADVATTVRLTHSNSDYPFDELEFFVRIGDPDNPTEQDDLDSADDWVRARLVEELVFVDDREILRSEAHEPFKGITPWWGTYDAQLTFPTGRQSIEIKIVSRQPDLHVSAVLSDWQVEVR